jgi:hypothetical protein
MPVAWRSASFLMHLEQFEDHDTDTENSRFLVGGSPYRRILGTSARFSDDDDAAATWT